MAVSRTSPGVGRFFSRPAGRFFALAAVGALIPAALALCFLLPGDGGYLLSGLMLYGALPLLSLLLPYWAGKGGVLPIAAFFPLGAPLLFLNGTAPFGLLSMGLSLVGSVAGQERRKRMNPKKGAPHGGQTKRT